MGSFNWRDIPASRDLRTEINLRMRDLSNVLQGVIRVESGYRLNKYHDLALVTEPTAPEAGVRLYAYLDGSDEVLRVKFSDGTVETIAPISSLSIDASQVTTGTFDIARIPDIPASKVTAGTFGAGSYVFPGAVQFTNSWDLRPSGDGTGDQTVMNLYTQSAGGKRWHIAARGDAWGTAGEQNNLRVFFHDGAAFNIRSVFYPNGDFYFAGTLTGGTVPAARVSAGTFGAGNYVFPAQVKALNGGTDFVNADTTLTLGKVSGGSGRALLIMNDGGNAHTWFSYSDGSNYLTSDVDGGDGRHYLRTWGSVSGYVNRMVVGASEAAFYVPINVENAADEHLRLDHTSATGSPYLSFYQSGTRRAYMQFVNGTWFEITMDDNHPFVVQTGADEILRLRHKSATGQPFLAWYQAGTQRAFMQYNNGGYLNVELDTAVGSGFTVTAPRASDGGKHIIFHLNPNGPFAIIGAESATTDEILRLRGWTSGNPTLTFYQNASIRAQIQYSQSLSALTFTNWNTGTYYFQDVFGGTVLRIQGGAPFFLVNGGSDEMVQLNQTSATGNPYISFRQNGTHRGSIQYDNGTGMSIRTSGGGIVRLIPDGVEALTARSGWINAYVKLFTTSLEDTATQLGQPSHSLVDMNAASNFSQPSGYRTMANATSTIYPPGLGGNYYYWNVLAKRDAANGYVGIAVIHNSGRAFIGYNVDGSVSPNWSELYGAQSPVIESLGDVIANV